MGKIFNEQEQLAILSIDSNKRDVFDGEYDFRKKCLDESLIGKRIYLSKSFNKHILITGYTTLLEVLTGKDVVDILNRTGNPKGSSERAIKDYFNRKTKQDTNDIQNPQGFYALHFDKVIIFKRPLPLFELSRISPGFALSDYVTYVEKDNIVYWILTEWGKQLGPDCQDPIDTSRKILVEARCMKK